MSSDITPSPLLKCLPTLAALPSAPPPPHPILPPDCPKLTPHLDMTPEISLPKTLNKNPSQETSYRPALRAILQKHWSGLFGTWMSGQGKAGGLSQAKGD